MKPFYVGLSRVSNPGLLHAAGRQVLALLHEGCFPGEGTAEIGTGPDGRPFFTAGNADFSISHSRSMAAVAYSTAPPLRTGCDIQYVKPLKNMAEIARIQFSPEEQAYIAAASGTEQLDRFYRIWVLKECFLKARGLSVFAMGTAPSFATAEGLSAAVKVPLHFFLYELGGNAFKENGGADRYLLAAARESGGPYGLPLPPEFRWFSETLPLRSLAAIKAVHRPVNTVRPKI